MYFNYIFFKLTSMKIGQVTMKQCSFQRWQNGLENACAAKGAEFHQQQLTTMNAHASSAKSWKLQHRKLIEQLITAPSIVTFLRKAKWSSVWFKQRDCLDTASSRALLAIVALLLVMPRKTLGCVFFVQHAQHDFTTWKTVRAVKWKPSGSDSSKL